MSKEPQPVFIIGAQRSGTTFLREWLKSFPGVLGTLQATPEPRVLRQLSFGNSADWRDEAFGSSWRNGKFSHLLEKSTSHLGDRTLAAVTQKHCPSAAIIVSLRDPIERAVSNYRLSVKSGYEDLPILEAFERDAERSPRKSPPGLSVNPFKYLRRGLYADQLAPWIENIPVSNLHITTFESLVTGEAGLGEVANFLGLAQSQSPPQTLGPTNTSSSPEIEAEHVTELAQRFGPFFHQSNDQLVRFGIDIHAWQHFN